MSTLLYFETRDLIIEHEEELASADREGFDIVLAVYKYPAKPDRRVKVYCLLQGDNARSMAVNLVNDIRCLGISIDGVVVWKDAEVPIAAWVASILSLPFTGVEAAERIRNKALQRQKLDELDNANPLYVTITNEKEFLEGLEYIGTPCLLKPAGASGAKGIFYINSNDEGIEKYRQFREHCTPERDTMFRHHKGIALVERRLFGTEHSVSGVVSKGRVVPLAVADKRLDHTIPLEYQNCVPSRLDPDSLQALVNLAISAVERLELKCCGFHVDAMVTPEGPRILEVGSRLGGYCINSHVIPQSKGISPYNILLKISLNEDPFSESIPEIQSANSRAGMRLILPPRVGKVTSIYGIDEVKKDRAVVEFIQLANPGDHMVLPSQKYKRFRIGYFIGKTSLETDFNLKMDQLCAKINIGME